METISRDLPAQPAKKTHHTQCRGALHLVGNIRPHMCTHTCTHADTSAHTCTPHQKSHLACCLAICDSHFSLWVAECIYLIIFTPSWKEQTPKNMLGDSQLFGWKLKFSLRNRLGFFYLHVLENPATAYPSRIQPNLCARWLGPNSSVILDSWGHSLASLVLRGVKESPNFKLFCP